MSPSHGTVLFGKETIRFKLFLWIEKPWGLQACLVYELYPEELMDIISRAFEDGLINLGMIDYQSFERALRRDKNEHLENLREDFERRSMDNIHDSMSWWACFNPESDFER